MIFQWNLNTSNMLNFLVCNIDKNKQRVRKKYQQLIKIGLNPSNLSCLSLTDDIQELVTKIKENIYTPCSKKMKTPNSRL